jgi:hypothetical protein
MSWRLAIPEVDFLTPITGVISGLVESDAKLRNQKINLNNELSSIKLELENLKNRNVNVEKYQQQLINSNLQNINTRGDIQDIRTELNTISNRILEAQDDATELIYVQRRLFQILARKSVIENIEIPKLNILQKILDKKTSILRNLALSVEKIADTISTFLGNIEVAIFSLPPDPATAGLSLKLTNIFKYIIDIVNTKILNPLLFSIKSSNKMISSVEKVLINN